MEFQHSCTAKHKIRISLDTQVIFIAMSSLIWLTWVMNEL